MAGEIRCNNPNCTTCRKHREANRPRDADSIALNAARKIMRDVHEATTPVDPRKNDQLQAKIQVAIIEAIREAKS